MSKTKRNAFAVLYEAGPIILGVIFLVIISYIFLTQGMQPYEFIVFVGIGLMILIGYLAVSGMSDRFFRQSSVRVYRFAFNSHILQKRIFQLRKE